MGRKKQSAADYIEEHDLEMRVILGEMVENAAKANAYWMYARLWARDRPEEALKSLVEAEIVLDVPLRIERTDALRRIGAASKLLDSELPDDDDITPE
jgi:hypothetical protein